MGMLSIGQPPPTLEDLDWTLTQEIITWMEERDMLEEGKEREEATLMKLDMD